MVVNDGPKQLVLYGSATRVTSDLERVDGLRAIAVAWGASEYSELDDEVLARRLDADGYGLLKITPTKISMS